HRTHRPSSRSLPGSAPPCRLLSFPTRRSSDLKISGILPDGSDSFGDFQVLQNGLPFLFPVSLPGCIGSSRQAPGGNPGQNCSILDRKSTRLNSSHVSISYAVFCLKKKNTTTTT